MQPAQTRKAKVIPATPVNSADAALAVLTEQSLDRDADVRAIRLEMLELDERMAKLPSTSNVAAWLAEYQQCQATKATLQEKLDSRKLLLRPTVRKRLAAILREQNKDIAIHDTDAAAPETLELLRNKLQAAQRRIDALMVALWEQAGAEFGWIKINEQGGGPHWQPLANHAEVLSLPGSPFNRANPAEGLYGAVRFKPFRAGALAKLPGKELCIRLYLDDSGILDEDLKDVAKLSNLQWLTLYRSEITDKGLKHLSDLKHLTRLGLHDSKVGDESMKVVANFTGLEVLGG